MEWSGLRDIAVTSGIDRKFHVYLVAWSCEVQARNFVHFVPFKIVHSDIYEHKLAQFPCFGEYLNVPCISHLLLKVTKMDKIYLLGRGVEDVIPNILIAISIGGLDQMHKSSEELIGLKIEGKNSPDDSDPCGKEDFR